MAILRNYARVGENTRAVEPWFTLQEGPRGYSLELKAACRRMANARLPVIPMSCPRCFLPSCFSWKVCYNPGYAGAWVFTCQSCKKHHFPPQWGPTEEQLKCIEKQRRDDVSGSAAAKARIRKATAERARKARAVHEHIETQPRYVKLKDRVARPLGISSNIPLGRSKGAPTPMREIKLVLWYKEDELPMTKMVQMKDACRICLADYSWVREACLAWTTRVFDHWLFDIGQWEAIPDAKCKVEVKPDAQTLFVRIKGLRCTGLGHELRLQEEKSGQHFTNTSKMPRDILEQDMPGYVYFAIWHADNRGPTLHKVLREHEHELRGIHWRGPEEVRGPHAVCYWEEDRSMWQMYGDGPARGSIDPRTRVVLLRRPEIVNLLALGDVLDVLDNDRAIRIATGDGLESHDDEHPIQHAKSTRASQLTLPPPSPSKLPESIAIRTVHTSLDDKISSQYVGRSTTDAREVLQGSSKGVAREFVQGNSKDGARKVSGGKDKGKGTPWQNKMRKAGYRVVRERGEDIIDIE
ncbi:hypothetical protein C8Q70DRAFT_1049903 [Cubamyces menziesii]|nr:hypothetical protein C8Q70DRAFT_1049903 [Cubamyces menziesii]